MGKFFNCLVSAELINEWASTLDWLFDDLKFSKSRNWNGGYTSSYTKKLKKLKYLSDKEKRVQYGKCKSKDFPNQCENQRKKRTPFIMMSSGDGFARDLIRHIRNGLAHGETNISKVKEDLYIEIIDFSDKTKKLDRQTAYLFLPLDYITKFFEIYDEINRAIINTKPADRKATNKFKKPKGELTHVNI